MSELPARASARLDALAARHGLPPAAVAQLERILLAVAEDPTAPTTVSDPVRAVDAHVADALAGLDAPGLPAAGFVADLGAGAGFPGLVLAAALPRSRVALVESVGRKCGFLERAAAAAGLGNVAVVNARAEEWRDGAGRCDVVTARAVAPLDVLAEYAAPLLREGGCLIAWKGRRDPTEEAAGARAAEILGLRPQPPQRVDPFPGAEHRHLYVYLKAGPTPDRFPRRAGMARKRPLGGSTSG